ncbi:MAG: hypothetical protein H6765_00775 [Candidatus Peribacteria bacterium]|nr:MAG: hypothetical protein H6765_00775 [Candidatus Peribacteria bacterium]
MRGDEYAFFNEVYGSPYFFSAPSYQALAPRTIELQHIYRQEDEAFKTVLNKIRLGLQTPEDLQLINQRCQHKPRGKTHAITLVTTNADADKINQQQLARLKTPLYQSQALIQGEVPASMYMNDPSANFKPGAQVMMLVNGPGYNNGSLGTIVSYDPVEEYAIVEINGEEYDIRQHKREIRKPSYDKAEKTIVNEVVGTFSQLPFKLARAITIHKSQGKTFEQVVVDFGKRVFSK